MTPKMRMWTGSKMLLMDSARGIEAITDCYSQQVLYDEIKDSSRVMYMAYDHVGQHGAAFELATGLRDANGREIYEGDVTQQHGGRCKIEFIEGCFHATKIAPEGIPWSIPPHIWHSVKVIGNVYENGCLLDDKD